MLILKMFKNIKSVLYKFLHCTASNNYPNIPLTYHLNYISCSLAQLNAFVKVLILGFFLYLLSYFSHTFCNSFSFLMRRVFSLSAKLPLSFSPSTATHGCHHFQNTAFRLPVRPASSQVGSHRGYAASQLIL